MAAEAGADASLVVTPVLQQAQPGRHPRPLRGGRRSRAGAADGHLQHPLAGGRQHRPRPACRAGADRQHRRRQAGQRRRAAARSTGSRSSPATTTPSCACSSSAAPAASLVASHLVGDADARDVGRGQGGRPRARPRDRRRAARRSTRALSVTTNPIPLKAALEMLGLRLGADAAAAGPADAEQRAAVQAALEGIGLPSPSNRLAESERLVPSKKLRVLPLGGLGEIGKNMTVSSTTAGSSSSTPGLMFPTAEMLGIDLVLPDFSYLRDRADDIEAIVLTHGHEDHVGALPYVLREIGDAAGHLRRPADDRHGPLEARRAQARATRRCRSCRRGRRSSAGPFELELVHLVALDPRHARRAAQAPRSARC